MDVASMSRHELHRLRLTGHQPHISGAVGQIDAYRRALGAISGTAGRLAPMRQVDDQGRPEPPLAADETATLLGFLDYQRATLAWKCAGLDAAGLQATTAASSMTLGGLLKHLAYVESDWFSGSLHGRARQPPWDTVDWKADPDWEWHSAANDAPEQLRTLWRDAVAGSRSLVAEALADGGLGQLAKRTWSDGTAPSLRWILCHMIEEYARHNGHADLLRESVDGRTGE
ncbi:DinB family protein [Pseudarthrobacter sp. N5]|uniref:DinB family protein n=1 Tax=Pseudarthrobacter sp. N5 TaxID=3418416 RepID=UPI003CEB980F